MKILMASSFFESHNGGLEIVAGELFRAFAEKECEIVWMAGNVTPPPKATGRSATVALPISNFVEDKIGLPFPIPAPTALGTILREVGKADVLLLHDCLYLQNILAYVFARLRGKPAVIVQHTRLAPFRSRLLNAIMSVATAIVTRPMLSRAEQVVFISKSTEEFFSQVRFRRTPELIFNGVNSDLYRCASAAEKASLRRRFGLPERQPVVLFVGRFVEKKGMAAMRHLAALRPEWIWAFAGWGPLDPSVWAARNVRVFSGLRGSSVADLYRACDSLVLPSWGEGFPLVIQEALACGMPVVCASETVQADPALQDHVYGASVYPGEDQHTALAFAPVIDEALASGIQGASGAEARRAFVVARYSWARAADRYIEALTRAHSFARSVASPTHSAAARNCP